jgi:uncharacterized repeat protein (TIGR03803 family)
LALGLGLILFGTMPSGQASTFTNLQLVWSFATSNGTFSPFAAVVEGSDGMLYGTTYGNYSTDYGGVFKVGKDGSNFSVLHEFSIAEGDTPSAPLLEATNGALYGTTWEDGTNGAGSIFRINKDGNGYAVLHNFSYATNDGASSVAALLQASDGQLYGTAQYGGIGPNGGSGVIFKMDLDGTNFLLLHSFTNLDGLSPQAPLIEGTNGVLYGTAYQGGVSSNGTIFRIEKDGSNFTVVYNFNGGTNDGSLPGAALLSGPNGKLYGTTTAGGIHNKGVAFSMDYNGSNFALLHHFGAPNDGSTPYALVRGPDGKLYGTTGFGGQGPSAVGTVFGIAPNGSNYTILVTFTNANGNEPNGIIAASNGTLYGTCFAGGLFTKGTVFRLSGMVPDILKSPISLGAGGWRVSGQGAPNTSYTLLFTTNLSIPSSNWTILGPVNADGSGNWHADEPTNWPQGFFRTSFP